MKIPAKAHRVRAVKRRQVLLRMKSPVIKQIRQYRNVFILTPVLMVISGILETMIPLITTHIIDDGISAGDMDAVFYWGRIMLVLAAGTLIFAFLGYLA